MTTPTIQSVTPTICAVTGVNPPTSNQAEAVPEIIEHLRNRNIGFIEKMLIFAPDAIGSSLLQRYPEIAGKFRSHSDIAIPLTSMTPPKTPVCFASMYSGAPPEIHGIQGYQRPILTIDTLFDALVRAGKRVALVAVKDCSIDIIFRNRTLSYYSESYDPEVVERTIQLIEQKEFDVIVCYQQEHDDLLHAGNPFTPEAVAAAHRHADNFIALTKAVATCWQGETWAIAVTPDHGSHVRPDGVGDHCDNIPEDMAVTHFWRFSE
ncbi:MAG: alkaline phosphatase family protein [bacterium]|nr:alkaline phosphatase family protein [bacterium]